MSGNTVMGQPINIMEIFHAITGYFRMRKMQLSGSISIIIQTAIVAVHI